MKFEFATAARIILGCGSYQQLPTLARGLGSTALLVVGRSGRQSQTLCDRLLQEGVRALTFHVDEEPTTGLVDQALAVARASECDLVIALGGGSVIDAGKAVSAMLTHPGNVLDYLELVGGGKPLVRPALPCIVVPTTAGTGAEVTRNSVLGVPEHRVKVSLRSYHLLPRLAIVDPELTCTLPPEVTARTGMDALTQLIEPFVSNAANPLTDGLCREGIKLAARSLARAFHDGSNLPAREDLCVAALFSGMALANAKLGAVHGLAGVLGGVTGHPHGAICARLLPLVMETNIEALRSRRPDAANLTRYDEVARILTGEPAALAADGVAWVKQLCKELAIPPLPVSGLSAAEMALIVSTAQRASSMQGNPVQLTEGELMAILEAAQ
jgi:alcohol dehydrogenase class IV